MKIKKGIVFKTCTAILGIIFMLVVNARSQDFLHEDDYDKKTKQGIVLVEFWASFNSVNEVNLKKIYDCKKYRVDMSQDPSLMTKHNVMAVPTVVIYHNGKEIKRFLPGLMLKLDVDVKEIQAVIDELVGDKF
jgi:thioredoxin-like negative regulator of GroEL